MRKTNILAGGISLLALTGGFLYYWNVRQEQDVDPPVMQAKTEEFTVGIQATDEELTAGIRALDQQDGDVSDSIQVESIRKSEEAAEDFLITYVAFDHSSNMAKLTQTLHYSDYRPARFAFDRPLRFPENQAIDLLSCFTADDCIDGDVTPFITLEGDKEVLDGEPKKGIYECTLSVTNSVGYTTRLPLEVEVYEDSYEERTFRPSIVLKQYIHYMKAGESFEPEDYLEHVVDGSIRLIDRGEKKSKKEGALPQDTLVSLSDIKIKSEVDTEKPGVYTVNYRYKSQETGYDCSTRLMVVVE